MLDILQGSNHRRERDVAIAAERTRTISVKKLHPVIGAEISDIDLRRPLDANTLRQIKDAWHEHTVLLFRDQELTEDDQRRFAANFGSVAKRVPPKPGATGVGDSPEWDDMMLVSDHVDARGKPLGTLGHGEMWFHTDKCYHRNRATFLYGIEIPCEGGHTRFSSMYAAYDRLPANLKRQLDGATVMQGQQYGVGRRIDVTLPLESTHHCRQPIFVTNPDSGRKALYVASQNSMWIEGMPRDESEALLQKLFAIAEDPAIVYEHVWRPGDLIMWDNLACLHARTDWPSDQRRTLRRCTVEGEPLY
jgi:taurine dioxygenase